jgi:uncharacterized protein (TIGR03083 family)
MRPAARLLTVEALAIRPILEDLAPSQFDLPTVCTGWSVRDVLGHCAAALTMTAQGTLHDFSPEENEADVAERRSWPVEDVLDELFRGYEDASTAIDAAGGPLDGIGLGEWIHGGDVREAVGAPHPYTSEGADLAFEVMLERSNRKPAVDVVIDGRVGRFGGEGEPAGVLRTDLETFMRLCSGRLPDPSRYELTGIEPATLVLFD